MTRPSGAALSRLEAERRIRSAMDHVEAAQCELERAAQDLSALLFVGPEWKALGAMRERVHALWYRVRATLERKKVDLDSDARERFLASLKAGE